VLVCVKRVKAVVVSELISVVVVAELNVDDVVVGHFIDVKPSFF
jgi:hypothetical protein